MFQCRPSLCFCKEPARIADADAAASCESRNTIGVPRKLNRIATAEITWFQPSPGMLCSLSSPELNLATQLFLIVMMQLHQNPRRSAYSLVQSRCMYSEPSRSVGHGLSTCKLPIQAHTHTHARTGPQLSSVQ